MASPLHLPRLQSPHHISRASPWMTEIKPASIHSVSSLSLRLSRRSNASFRAQGRGFGLNTTSNDKPKPAGSNNSNEEGEEDEEDAIPGVVFDRMLIRIASFVGVPMASGVGLLYVLSSLKEQGIWESPAWLPFLTTLLSFGTSALGIAYGTLSTSWDTDREGSLLGWAEAQKNWPELWKEEEEGKKETPN